MENASDYSIPGDKATVPCKRLDGLGIIGDSLILKIDVEGQERNVLDGALGFFRANRVKAVYVDGYKDKEVESLLSGHGFTLLDGRTLQPIQKDVFSLLAIRANVG